MDGKVYPTMTRLYMFILPSSPNIVFVTGKMESYIFWSSYSYAMRISNNQNTSWYWPTLYLLMPPMRSLHDYFPCQSVPEICCKKQHNDKGRK